MPSGFAKITMFFMLPTILVLWCTKNIITTEVYYMNALLEYIYDVSIDPLKYSAFLNALLECIELLYMLQYIPRHAKWSIRALI